ncbi:MAG: DUF1805 domain-containing protein [Candidatus Omnitrophota bacterium]
MLSPNIEYRKIKCGRKLIEAFCIKLMSKNLILLLGSKGYIMCGYLNMRSADKFKDPAVRITGVSTINESLKADAGSLSREAKRLGIYEGQPIKEVLKIIG